MSLLRRFAAIPLILALLLLVSGSWYTVDQGEEGVVLRFGETVRIASHGLNFKVPLMESVVKISTRSDSRVYDGVESYSQDQQPAEIRISVTYQVPPGETAALYAKFGSTEAMMSRLLDRKLPQVLKIVFGRFSAATAIADRGRLNLEVYQALIAGIEDQPVLVEGVQVEDIKFSPAYEHSIEERMLAEVEVQKLRQNAEREKVQAQITVTKATAEADAVRAAAEAEADAIRLRGEAEAAAISARGAAIRDNPGLIDLTKAERWNGQLPTTMLPNGTVPFIGVQ